MSKPLTKAEHAELAAAGIVYPCPAQDLLHLAREVRFLNAIIVDAQKNYEPSPGTGRTFAATARVLGVRAASIVTRCTSRWRKDKTMGSGKPRALPILKTAWQIKADAALEDSIAHWDRMARGDQEKGEGPYSWCCACCDEWPAIGCKGCPLQCRTKEAECDGTPYDVVYMHWRKDGIDSDEFKAAAAVMRDYLIETLHLVRAGEVKP